jgi:hypothetical protein
LRIHIVILPTYNAGYDDPRDFSDDELEDYYDQGLFLLNATTFAATLLKEDLFASDFLNEVDKILQLGIDQSYDEASRIKPREWQVLLPAATAWLLIAGKTIYDYCLCDEAEEASGKESSRTRVDRWRNGRRIWNREMWKHWKDRLQSLANQRNIDGEYRALAARTATEMVKIENVVGGTA